MHIKYKKEIQNKIGNMFTTAKELVYVVGDEQAIDAKLYQLYTSDKTISG